MKKSVRFVLVIPMVLTGLAFFTPEGHPFDMNAEEVDNSRANPADSIVKRLPVIQNDGVSIVYPDEVEVKYSITDDGGDKIIYHGLVWDTHPFPYSPKNYCSSSPIIHLMNQSKFVLVTPGRKYYVTINQVNKI